MNILLILLIMLVSPIGAHWQGTERFIPGACPFELPAYQIECGWLRMPEDHHVPQGAQISLAVVIIRSPNIHKQPDPVLFLQGGPGAEVLKIAPFLLRSSSMASILQQRDLILVDQRGMGYSRPAISCAIFDTPAEMLTLSPSQLSARVGRCPARLETAGIDWRHYTTSQNAADLAQVGPALGYQQVNLFGVSYGTLLGLLILRDHPEVVRSAVLDSVIPPGPSMIEQSARWNAEIFARVEADCQADWLCHLAYPDMRNQLMTSYQRLSKRPAAIRIPGATLPLDAHFFAAHSWVGSRADAEQLPAFIRAFAEQDYHMAQPFLRALLTATPDTMPNLAIYAAMSCPYQAASTSPQQIATAFAPYALPFQAGRFTIEDWQRCQAWSSLPAESLALPRTDVPVLLLSGAYDAIAPPVWGSYAAQNLSRGQVVEVPYTGHTVTSSGGVSERCTVQMMTDFLAMPTRSVERSCLTAIPHPTFILHRSVTRLPLALLLAPLLLVSAGGLTRVLLAWWKRPAQVGWQVALRRVGLLPLLVGVLTICASIFLAPHIGQEWPYGNPLMPLALGLALQASVLLAPESEPALEVTSALPRPLSWLMIERFGALLLCYSIVGMVCSLIGYGLQLVAFTSAPLAATLLGWLAPALLLSSIGLYSTVRSRLSALGLVVVLALWVLAGIFGRFLLLSLPLAFPLNLSQPFVWVFHLHAGWNELSARDYLINRLMQLSLGMMLMMRTIRYANDSERMLLGARHQHTLQADMRHTVPPERPVLALIRPSWLAQLAAIAYYELLMLWRQRALRVVALSPIGIFGMLVALNIRDRIIDPASTAYLPGAEQRMIVSEFIVWALAPFLLALALWVLPLLVAGMIPTDRQLGVHEWLRSLPLPGSAYLGGKIAGALLAGGATGLLVGMACALIWLLSAGSFTPTALLSLLALFLLLLPWTTSCGVALGATQSSPVGAIALVMALLIAPEFLQSVPLIQQLLPGQTVFIDQCMHQTLLAMSARPPVLSGFIPLPEAVAGIYGLLALKAVLACVIALGWQRRSMTHD